MTVCGGKFVSELNYAALDLCMILYEELQIDLAIKPALEAVLYLERAREPVQGFQRKSRTKDKLWDLQRNET